MKRCPYLIQEDYQAIWIGLFFIITALIILFATSYSSLRDSHKQIEHILSFEKEKAPFKSVTWHVYHAQQLALKAENLPAGKVMDKLSGNLKKWSDNPVRAFYKSRSAAGIASRNIQPALDSLVNLEAKAYAMAVEAENEARAESFNRTEVNEKAIQAINSWIYLRDQLSSLQPRLEDKGYNRLPWLTALFVVLSLFFGLSHKLSGGKFWQFVLSFFFIVLLGLLAFLLGSNQAMKDLGIGYAAWAILLGIIISNTVGVPGWVMPAVKTEFYIKTGLVLLGAEILIGKIMAIGLPGLMVAWVVTPVVLVSTYWFGQKVLKIKSRTLNITISADMSVCGVSAAIATAAACRAKKEELTLAVGLSMVFTSVMMIVLPLFIQWIGMPEVLGGAWIGGTIDATGAVVAAGAFLGDTAMAVAATIKMIQNVLIGLIAFAVAVYFTSGERNDSAPKVSVSEVWLRLPKFILGFMGASVLLSGIYFMVGDNLGYSLLDNGLTGGFTSQLRSWLFCLAFISIGLSTRYQTLKKYFSGGKPLILYVCGQTLNLLLTLAMAYIVFYLVFPEITERL